MATGLPTIDVNSVGGVKSLQDLYTMLAGSETTTSGGTTTTTDSISQSGMNEMLASALANTNGLAAVSSGQRAAGGYGSSVNTMLTNDLLTRTASQIAQANKTTTQTKSPTTVTTGGITGAGAKKSISFIAGLQGLQELDKMTGASKKIKEYLGSDDSAATASPTFSGVSTNSVGYSPAADSQAAYVDSGSDAGGGGEALSYDMVDAGAGFDFGSAAMDEAANTANNTEFAPLPDELMFEGFADGGEVSTNKQRPNILGTSQFNRVVDSRAGKIGGGAGANAEQTPSTPTSSVSSNETSSGSSSSSSSGKVGGDSLGKFVGALATDDGQKFAKALGVMGKLTQSSVLQQAGLVGSIATSKNPVQSAALTAGNIATKGALGQGLNVYKAMKDPGIATGVDAAASLNPITAGVNGILSMLGFRTIGETAGDVKNNLDLRSGSRNPMSPEQQQAAKDWVAQQGQEVSENPDIETTPVDGPGNANDGGTDTSGGSSGGNYKPPAPDPTNSPDAPDPSGLGTMGGGGYGTESDGGGFATGGEISGPGTGTSDSIPARLSDGETVITAKTTQKAKEMFGEDFFLKLEAEFNAPAAARQMTKGRA